VLLLINPYEGSVPFRIPECGQDGWVLELSTAGDEQMGQAVLPDTDFPLPGRSIVLLRRP